MKMTVKKIAAVSVWGVYTAALLFIAYLLEYGPVKIIRYCILSAAIFYLAYLDIKSRIVPNRILLVLLAIRLFLLIPETVLYPDYLSVFITSSVFGAVAAMLLLIIGNLIAKKGMGYGDIKLFGVIGFYVGMQSVLGILFFSLVFAAVYCIVLLIRKKISARDEIPFVPFVFAGFAAASLLGV